MTLRMPAYLANKLERAARRMGRKRSEIVRLALEQFLNATAVKQRVRPINLVRDLLGKVESGLPDLGQRHREYLVRQ